MQVSSIRVRDIENRWESLSLSFQAVARWAGVELHIRSIDAAMGVSFMTSAPHDKKTSLAWWMTFGRDVFLIETGRLFGLKIRKIYDAAQAPGSHEQFNTIHKPVIQKALSDNQPVLAWQGWPDYHSYLWGVLTDRHDGPLGLQGSTMWAHGKLLPVTNPPKAVYVVEELSPRQPTADELLHFATRHIQQVIHGRLDARYGVETGLPAYDRWLEWLSEPPDRHYSGDSSPNAHYQMARFVTHSRESACRFIDYYKDGLHDNVRPFLDALYADCQGVINALSTSRDLRAVEVLYRSDDGREVLSAGVKAARDFLKVQIKTIDHLADKLGIC